MNGQREYKVMCANMHATYSAGRFIASSPEEACQMAREEYANSSLGRDLKDAGAFRFYTVSKFPHEREEEED
jgi:hypothetical protein